MTERPAFMRPEEEIGEGDFDQKFTGEAKELEVVVASCWLWVVGRASSLRGSKLPSV